MTGGHSRLVYPKVMREQSVKAAQLGVAGALTGWSRMATRSLHVGHWFQLSEKTTGGRILHSYPKRESGR